MILLDPSSGRYVWDFGPVPLNETTSNHMTGYGTISMIYVSGDRLVDFSFGLPYLVAHETFGKASSVDDAEAKAIAEATGRLPAKLMHKTDDRVMINLVKFLPHEFFQACAICSGPAPTKIIDITHKGNTWELTLQGQWREKVTLNDKYEVTGTTRLN